MTEQFRISDDMLDFAQKLDAENHNVKSYRKRQTSKKNNHQSRHKKSQNSMQLFGFTFCEDGKMEKSVEKTARTTQVLSTKRFASTAGVKKRSQLDINSPAFNLTARSKISSALQNVSDAEEMRREKVAPSISMRETPDSLGKFSKKEKEMCKKGQLQNKHFEEWLNQTLLQYCPNQKFDMTIENSALKKYGIDKNSLLSKGINPENLDRIFRALFVYSMGFNSLLKELGGRHIRKSLWKVYAILLQYCSDGDFQTMVGQIERDKVAKMDLLRGQIQKRQEVIDNNEQIHQQKNAKIFKQLKHLRETNSELVNDKNSLMQDFKEAEQAFNEQVSLRLKFQNKINQIHGVHRELGIKHQKLYDDLQIKANETNVIKQKLSSITEKYIHCKADFQLLSKSKDDIYQENKFNLEQVELLKDKVMNFEMKEIEWGKKQTELKALIHEKEKKVEQAKKQISNAELMIQLKEDAEQQLQKEYQRSLDQNKQLLQSLQTQLQQLSKCMKEKKQFNDTHSRLYAELSVVTASLIQKKEEIEKNRKTIKELASTLHDKEEEVETVERKCEQFQISLNDCYKKIEQMKRVKSEFEEELTDLKEKQQAHKLYYDQKEKELLELNQKLETAQRRISEFYITKKTLQSKVTLLTQKIVSDEQMSKRKVERLQQELKTVDKQRLKLRSEIEEKRAETNKHILLYEEILAKLKDHIFERNDLELKYSQSLVVVENQTDHIKHLNIKISELQERNEEILRKMKGIQFLMEGKEKTYKMEISALKNNIETLKEELKFKKNYIHPMKYQDLRTRIIEFDVAIQTFKDIIKKKELNSQEKALNMKIEKLKRELEINQEAHQQILSRKDKMIESEREKNAELQSTLKELVKQKEQLKTNHSFREKQRKYLDFIQEKSSKIEELLKQLQKLQDSHTRMMKSLEETQIQLKKKEEKIAELQNKQTHIQVERQKLKHQRSNLEREKKTLQSKLSEQQFELSKTIEKLNEGEGSSNPMNRDVKSRQKSRGTSRQEKSREKLQQRADWRNDFSKKVKNAYSYYQK